MKLVKNESPKTVYWLGNKLYLNITNQCSNRCFFCIRNYKRGIDGFNLKLLEEPSSENIENELGKVLHMRNWEEMVFCGFGEPTERLDVLLEITRWTKQNYASPLKIRVNTNGLGYILNRDRDVASEMKAAGIDKVSVSINANDKETYNEVCKPTFVNAFDEVLEFIRKAKTLLEVETTALRIPEVDLAKVRVVANKLGVNFRVREYIPCFY
jgi:GTP 3',8-cyclase